MDDLNKALEAQQEQFVTLIKATLEPVEAQVSGVDDVRRPGQRDVRGGARRLPRAVTDRRLAGHGVKPEPPGDVPRAALSHAPGGPTIRDGFAAMAGGETLPPWPCGRFLQRFSEFSRPW